MANTQVSKSLNLALQIWYQFLSNGEIPRVKTVGHIPDSKWVDFFVKIKGKELTRFKVPVIHHPPKSPGYERDMKEKFIFFEVGNVDFGIKFLKDTETDEWLLHSIDWSTSFPAYSGRRIWAG